MQPSTSSLANGYGCTHWMSADNKAVPYPFPLGQQNSTLDFVCLTLGKCQQQRANIPTLPVAALLEG